MRQAEPAMASSDFENEIRRMLQRRAADIPSEGEAAVGAANAGPPDGWDRWILAAAAALVLLIAAGAVLTQVRSRSAVESIAAEDVEEISDDGSNDSPEPTGSAQSSTSTDANAADQLTPDQAWSAALAGLPPGFDPVSSPAVHIWFMADDVSSAAQFYMARRLSGAEVDGPPPPSGEEDSAAVDIAEVGQRDGVWLHRWESGELGGWLMQRFEYGNLVVVATTVDGVDVTSVERTVDELSLELTTAHAGQATVSLVTLSNRRIGETEVLTSEINLVERPVGPEVVVVAAGLEGIDEIGRFAVRSAGFVAACDSSQPPISIDVGAHAGPLEPGPISPGRPEPLLNQQVWHHLGDRASLEIRWPATPSAMTEFDRDRWGESRSAQRGHPFFDGLSSEEPSEEFEGTVVLVVADDPNDPCSLVEVLIPGEAAVAAWWSTAISAEWQFELPLTIAEQDPAEAASVMNPNPPPQTDEPLDLIVERRELAAVPTIAETGSCDGDPEAGPQVGSGSEDVHPTAEEALMGFLAEGPHGDPPIATNGYTEVVVDGVTAAFALVWDDVAYTVIHVENGPDGWAVDSWTAAAC